MTFDEHAWAMTRRREAMQRRARSIAYNGGYVADLPHPIQTSTGNNGLCEVCGGHFDRRIHDKPWQKPIFGACQSCAGHPNAECDVCGDTRLGFHRIGIEEVGPAPKPPKPWRRPWMPGSKRNWHKRRRPKARDAKPRAAEKQRLREAPEYIDGRYEPLRPR